MRASCLGFVLLTLVACDDDTTPTRFDGGAGTGAAGRDGAGGGTGGGAGMDGAISTDGADSTGGAGPDGAGGDGAGGDGTGGADAGTVVDQALESPPPDLAAEVLPPDGNAVPCGGCGAGLTCLVCPLGGPAARYLCTTTCRRDQDCTNPARPKCNIDTSQQGPPSGICTETDQICLWGSRCAAPDTPVATPQGERAIASLRPGDLVFSKHQGRLVAVPLARVLRLPVAGHHVVRVSLDSGAVLEMSEGHPTADGRSFRDLLPGATLGSTRITSVQSVPYRHPFTYDILPASDSATYVAGGALVGSTLAGK